MCIRDRVMTKFDSMFQAIVRVFLVSLFFFTVGVSRSSGATLRGLTIEDESSTVRIALSERVPFNVVRVDGNEVLICLLYTSPSPRDLSTSRMPSSA
eukprot:TRINITY_DN40752_c0_g1_i1.p2 TRINITY_DN40752_c0_g1~~TRINITY_DN40752_c0_g1_i1.p2  ORF type:complete len:106 (+),score=17.46 TRINITY_DN40752_c0_g1_i1:28-318(+)